MTATEYLKSKEPNTFIVPEEFLIEFAQYHVENALKEARRDAQCCASFTGLYFDSILNCYQKIT